MPLIIRGFRHNHDGSVGRTADAAHRCGPACSCRRPAPARRDSQGSTNKLADTLKSISRRLDAVGARADRMTDSLASLAPRLQALATARREALAHQQAKDAAPGGIVSATTGYVRDAAGNRIRSMTTADLQAMADAHYGRGKPQIATTDRTDPRPFARPTTGADLGAIHAVYYGRA